MNDDLLNILSNSNKDIDNQKLMDYLSGKLSAAEKLCYLLTYIDKSKPIHKLPKGRGNSLICL